MSTYSPSLRIELITTGDQAGTWGTTTNSNLGTLIESAIAGYTSVSITSADQALTALNGAADQSRHMVVALTTTTTAAFNVYAPPAEKTYVIRNASAYTATIYNSTVLGNTTAAGSGVAIPAGKTMTVWSDGTNFAFQNTHIVGTVVGDVTGNVTGNLTGNVTGNVSGNAGTVTNGVYTTGNQTIGGNKVFTGVTQFSAGTGGGIAFPPDPGGGTGDAAWIRYYAETGENTVLELGISNDSDDNIWLNAAGGTLCQNNFTATGNVTAFSDERLKTNWRPLPDSFVEQLAQVKHGIYDRVDTEETQAGASAQAMQKLLPEVVHTNADGMLSIAYGNAALVAAIKLAEKVVELEARLAKLEA